MNPASAAPLPSAKSLPYIQRTRFVFAITLGLSAGLLFWIQPLVAKTILPIAGGAPAVWHTVIVFFQATLLLGYIYAHWITTHCPTRFQGWVHGGLVTLAIILLPWARADLTVQLDTQSPHSLPLQLWLRLLQTIGLPCFVVSSTSPLLQAWYSSTHAPDAKDPYSLYAASNLGSLFALLGFPLFAESYLTLSSQFQMWSIGYLVFGFWLFLCRRSTNYPSVKQLPHHDVPSQTTPTVAATNHAVRWFGLAFLSSSLLLGATTFLTTEVLNAPLIGILPLALFLISYVIAFGQSTQRICRHAPLLTRLALVAVVFQLLTRSTDPAWMVLLLHLGLVLTGCLLIHSRLAALRPSPKRLTNFYLWIAVGGVVAGILHSFLCPYLFNQIWEYPLTLVFVAGLSASATTIKASRNSWRLLIAATAGAIVIFGLPVFSPTTDLFGAQQFDSKVLIAIVVAALFFTSRHRPSFMATLAVLFLLQAHRNDGHGTTLFVDRNFYGVSRVTLDPNKLTRRLVHGNTIHGRQSLDPSREHLPLSYYHLSGPLNRIMKQYEAIESKSEVAVVGLGAGSMLYYGKPEQRWTLYEIDPLVIQLAKTRQFFGFLETATVSELIIQPGDARIELQHAASGQFDLILLDAFSSDSIPMHLFTLEALELYLSKLTDTGLLAFHISNRTLNLAPILGRLANELNLIAISWNDSHDLPIQGKDPSHWAVLARTEALLSRFKKDYRWKPIQMDGDVPLWTDERSNILEALPLFRSGPEEHPE